MPEIGASGSASGDGKRPLPHGLILDAGSMTCGGAGEGNRTLVISLEDSRLRRCQQSSVQTVKSALEVARFFGIHHQSACKRRKRNRFPCFPYASHFWEAAGR